jgi:hypothetical protein
VLAYKDILELFLKDTKSIVAKHSNKKIETQFVIFDENDLKYIKQSMMQFNSPLALHSSESPDRTTRLTLSPFYEASANQTATNPDSMNTLLESTRIFRKTCETIIEEPTLEVQDAEYEELGEGIRFRTENHFDDKNHESEKSSQTREEELIVSYLNRLVEENREKLAGSFNEGRQEPKLESTSPNSSSSKSVRKKKPNLVLDRLDCDIIQPTYKYVKENDFRESLNYDLYSDPILNHMPSSITKSDLNKVNIEKHKFSPLQHSRHQENTDRSMTQKDDTSVIENPSPKLLEPKKSQTGQTSIFKDEAKEKIDLKKHFTMDVVSKYSTGESSKKTSSAHHSIMKTYSTSQYHTAKVQQQSSLHKNSSMKDSRLPSGDKNSCSSSLRQNHPPALQRYKNLITLKKKLSFFENSQTRSRCSEKPENLQVNDKKTSVQGHHRTSSIKDIILSKLHDNTLPRDMVFITEQRPTIDGGQRAQRNSQQKFKVYSDMDKMAQDSRLRSLCESKSCFYNTNSGDGDTSGDLRRARDTVTSGKSFKEETKSEADKKNQSFFKEKNTRKASDIQKTSLISRVVPKTS